MRSYLHRVPLVRKVGLLAVAVLALVALMSAPRPVQACNMWTEWYTYYYDAEKTEPAGWCEFDCYCVSYCEGDRTPYFWHAIQGGCL